MSTESTSSIRRGVPKNRRFRSTDLKAEAPEIHLAPVTREEYEEMCRLSEERNMRQSK